MKTNQGQGTPANQTSDKQKQSDQRTATPQSKGEKHHSDTDVDTEEETTEQQPANRQSGKDDPNRTGREERENDPTRIKPGVNEPRKNDPTRVEEANKAQKS